MPNGPKNHPAELRPGSLGASVLQRGDAPAKSRSAMWFLSGRLSPKEDVRHIPITCSPFLIGRGPNAALCLASMTVSSAHAELIDAETSLTLRDLGSTNGTYVNGKRMVGTAELHGEDLVQFGEMPFRVLRQNAPANTSTVCEDVMDRALALVQFDRLMNECAVVPHYQPIVDLRNEQVWAFEVLVRTRIVGLETPASMFSVAAQLNLETQLSRMIRAKAVQETRPIVPPPHLFLNTHPRELQEPGIRESMEAVRTLSPFQQITLEIHEKAVTDAAAMVELRSLLRDLDVGLAFDDFGAGQARLLELTRVHPDYLKFDMALIRSIDLAPREHRRMVGSLVRMVRDMDIVPVAEGIETREERDACLELDFELSQGFYFGKPVALRHVSE
ncbi:MAG: EAL domain-containing protein [Pirellulales bacterium]|nr:EAL domain-containing protein [Pirellulales bacterium]